MILTENLTLFWPAIYMLVNEYKPEFQFRKDPKNAEFRQCLNLSASLCYEQNRCAERTGFLTEAHAKSCNFISKSMLIR